MRSVYGTEAALVADLGLDIALRQCQIGSFHIRYAVCGSGPPLLLLHGANFGWGVWYPNLEALAEHYTVYALDLPGAGRSSIIDYAQLDLQRDLADVVSQFIQLMNFDQLSIVGCSAGGWIALKMGLDLPDRVDRLVVENTVGFADYMTRGDKVIGWYPFARLLAGTVLRPGPANPRIESFLRGILYQKDLPLRDSFVDYFYETQMRSHNLLFISRMTALHEDFLLEDRLPQLLKPTLILWGKEDKIMPLVRNEHHFGLIPDVSVEIVEQAGHIPSLERPEIFNAHVLRFLQGEVGSQKHKGLQQAASSQHLQSHVGVSSS